MAEFNSNDPLRPLLSLANQKTLQVSEKFAEKVSAMGESSVLTEAREARDRLRGIGVGAETSLADIAQSSIFQGNEVLFDAAHGVTRSPEEIQELGDIARGVTEEARQRLVTQPQQEVIESLAANNYWDALVGSVKAAPGTLADSANVIPETLAGVGLTIAGGSGLAVLGNRVRKIFGGVSAVTEKVSKAKKEISRLQLIKNAAKTIPKTASQMSVVTADITQRQVADFEIEHGERPSKERITQFYLTNLITMTAEGGILKQLFIPKFRKELSKEARAVLSNLKGGSNIVSIGKRIAEGIKKVLIAGGAEAAQEYAQTWADIVNVGVGPNEEFLKGMKREFGSKDSRLEALGGAFLGFGAGGLARGVVAAPAIAAGTTLDTAKGTVKAAVGTVKFAGKQVQKVGDALAYKVLSKEEREVIRSEHESRKEIVDVKVAEFKDAVTKIKSATTMEALHKDPAISKVISGIVNSRELTDEDLKNKKVFKGLKQDAIRNYRGDIGLLELELSGRTGANVAKRVGKNIGVASVDAATAVMDAASPGVKAVVDGVKKYGPKVIEAVEEIRSSTALGMIELAANAGKEETKQILAAAKGLSMDDLKRTRNVVKEFNKKIALKLDQEILKKRKALERAGIKTRDIINEETLHPDIKAAAKPGNVTALKPGDAAGLSSLINNAVGGKIEDLESLNQIEKALNLLEGSSEFKSQTKGAMSRDNMVITRRKIKRARRSLDKAAAQEGRSTVDKAIDKVVEAAEVVKETAGPAVEAVTDKVKEKAGEISDKVEARSKKRAEKKAKETYKPELINELKDLEAAAKMPKLTEKLIERMPEFIKMMKDSGIENRADFEIFLEQFPGVQENVKVFKELDDAYPSSVIVDEVSDTIGTFFVDTEQAIRDAYNRINPNPECKV